MSQQLSNDSGSTSSPNSAPDASSDSPLASSASNEAAEGTRESSNGSAASGDVKTIDQIDAEYKQNMLAPDKEEVEPEPEPSQPEKVEAKTEEPEAVAEPTEDDLVERTEPRSADDFKKLFPRSEPKAREELARIETANYALQKELGDVGGTEGLEIAKAVMPALLSANPTNEDADTVFQNVTETNPELMKAMSWNILTHSLKEQALDPASQRPISMVTGDAIIKEFLNDNYDVEKIEQLIAFDEAGLLDKEELAKELESFTGKSKRELELESRLKAVEDKDKQAEADLNTKAEARVAQHVEKTEKYVVSGAMSQIVPIAEQYGWTATKEELASTDPAVKANAEFKVAFGEFLTPWLDQFVKSHVKWAGVQSLGKGEQAFNQDGNPTILLKKNGQEVINAAIAAFKGKVRVMNTAFAKAAGVTRNAQLKAKTTRSGAVENSEIPPVRKAPENGSRSPHADIAAADEAYQRSIRESRASL